ncbi:hypothetical protein BH24ACT18_BH24ACT18_20490 [soil metagenome]|nr:hypothetical protein [Actinomycetota bacterium]
MGDQGPKRLDEMDDLRDMGRFPLPVYVGATSNILLTICLTYLLKGRFDGPLALPAWAGGIISANVLPVIALRSRMDEDASFPPIEEMGFFGDQHKFSTWVYAVASGNMLFWIVLSWSVFSRRRDGKALAGMLVLAFACTFFPAWVRLFRQT